MSPGFLCSLSLPFLVLASTGSESMPEGVGPEHDSPRVVEEITVTAAKREAAAHETSISIEALSGETLEAFEVRAIDDLSTSVPAFHSGFGLLTQTISLRGIGSGAERSFEQAVAFFVDGLYLPRSRQISRSFLDVERVEVMRGPQSVLHGLNATAGAISVISRRTAPGDEFFFDLTADYELEYGGAAWTTTFGGSPSERLGLRAALRYADADGADFNTFSEREEGERESFSGRLSASWAATDDVSIWAKVEHDRRDLGGHAGEIYGPRAALLEPDDGRLDRRRSGDGTQFTRFDELGGATGQEIETTDVALRLDAVLGAGTLSLNGGWTELDYRFATDIDGAALPLLDGDVEELGDQRGLELRYAGATRELSYVVGAFHHRSEMRETQTNVYGEAALGSGIALIPESIYHLDTELSSLFVHVARPLTDKMRLLGGVRWSREEKEAQRRSSCGLILLPDTSLPVPDALARALCPSAELNGIVGERDSENLLPEAALEWNPSEDVLIYAKVGRSAKGGGFSAATFARAEDFEYDDEIATGWELGLKARLAGGRADLGAALFSTRIDDLQATAVLIEEQDGLQIVRPVIRNAARATSRGLELQGRAVIGRSLLLSGSFALLDAAYDSFAEAPCNTVAADPTGVCDLSGLESPFAPSWSADVQLDWESSLPSGARWRAGLDVALSDAYFTEGTLDPHAVQDEWTRVSARIGWTSADGRWSAALIGRNLTDEIVLESSQPFGSTHFLGYLAPPRTIRLQTTVRLRGGGADR